MKRIFTVILATILVVATFTTLSACSGSGSLTIAVPNDTTNEARALMLLQELGYIKLKEGADITATPRDITENPYNITFKEVEAAQLPNVRRDVDYAIINSNYAIEAKLSPASDSLALEGSSSAYNNILAVKAGAENTDKIKALTAALKSQKVINFIEQQYNGAVISVINNPGNGFDATVDYQALDGTTISIAGEILAERNITLRITEYTDYIQPNNVVDSGEIDANYFQHTPYLEDFNQKNGTNLISAAEIHVEPMGLYGGKQTSLDAIGGK